MVQLKGITLAFQQKTLYNERLFRTQTLQVGQASALFLGTFPASAADSLGRKRACLLFGALPLLGCLGKLLGSFLCSLICTCSPCCSVPAGPIKHVIKFVLLLQHHLSILGSCRT